MKRLFLLLAAHALCDYPLQGDFLARGKNHKSPLPAVPWYQCLAAHALIHGGAENPFAGCNLVYRRMKAFGMLAKNGDFLLDILDAEGDIIQDFYITKRGFEYLRSKLHFVREN